MKDIKLNLLNRKIITKGLVVFLFVGFSVFSWKWVGKRGKEIDYSKNLEQFPIGIDGNEELLSLGFNEDPVADGVEEGNIGARVIVNTSENEELSAIDIKLSFDPSKLRFRFPVVRDDMPFDYGFGEELPCNENRDLCFLLDRDNEIGEVRISVFNFAGDQLPQIEGEMMELIFEKNNEDFEINFAQSGNQVMRTSGEVIEMSYLGGDIVVGLAENIYDLNNDGVVNDYDYDIFNDIYEEIFEEGYSENAGKIDFNSDGKVNVVDFGMLKYYYPLD